MPIRTDRTGEGESYAEDEDTLAGLEARHVYCVPGYGERFYQRADFEGDVVREVVEECLVEDYEVCQTTTQTCRNHCQ